MTETMFYLFSPPQASPVPSTKPIPPQTNGSVASNVSLGNSYSSSSSNEEEPQEKVPSRQPSRASTFSLANNDVVQNIDLESIHSEEVKDVEPIVSSVKIPPAFQGHLQHLDDIPTEVQGLLLGRADIAPKQDDKTIPVWHCGLSEGKFFSLV